MGGVEEDIHPCPSAQSSLRGSWRGTNFLDTLSKACARTMAHSRCSLSRLTSINQGRLPTYVRLALICATFQERAELTLILAAVIQTPNSPLRIFSCVLRINVLDGSSRGIFFDTNIPRMDILIDRLRLRQDLSEQNSLHFLSLLFEEYGQDCERWRRELDRDVVRLETKTGMTSRALAHTLDDQTLDYESLTKRLHRCHTDLIFLDTVQNFEACLGDFCKKAAVQLETMRQQLDLEASSVSDQNIFFQNVDYHLNQNELRRFQTTCLQKRIQTQINVVRAISYRPLY